MNIPAELSVKQRIINRAKRTIKELRYALHLTTHPIKGFWEIKHENEGSLFTAGIILFLTVVVRILSSVYTGFIFSPGSKTFYNFTDTVVNTIALYAAWCIGNWCLTCLFDGEGTVKDIAKATAYALVPYVVIQLIMIFLSNYFINREMVFYNMLGSLSVVWTAGLLLLGMMSTHQYTLTKTIVVCIFTIGVMIAMGYLIMLFFYLIQQVVSFVSIYIEELTIRMSGS